MRITTSALINNYSRNLGKTTLNLDYERQRVLTKRNFNSIDEDPAAAIKSFQLRREYTKNEDYLSNIQSTQSLFDGIESSAMEINKSLQEINKDTLEAINGATSLEARKTLATSMREKQKSIILSANARFGDNFIFGGNETSKVPFVLQDDGVLTYRGINVNSTDPKDMEMLDKYANEARFTDIGFGLKEMGGELLKDSAFDTALPGIELLGHGNTADGVSKNVITLLGDLATELEKPVLDETNLKKLTDQLTTSRNEVLDSVAQLGTKSTFLESTKTRLEDNRFILNEKIVALENVDLAEAISSYSFAQYAYNAALKVGTSIMSQSFIDFMR